MKITKYEHACVVVEVDGRKLVIDPGELTTSQFDVANVTAVVITHEHFDHFDPKKVEAIKAANPDVKIFSTSEVVTKLPGTILAEPSKPQTMEPFTLRFFGEHHEAVHPDLPTSQNVAVLVNETIYYAGDSFVKPDKAVQLLLAPSSGPWQRLGEVMDFIVDINPKQVLLTHDALNSEVGQRVAYTWFKMFLEKRGGMELKALNPTESLQV